MRLRQTFPNQLPHNTQHEKSKNYCGHLNMSFVNPQLLNIKTIKLHCPTASSALVRFEFFIKEKLNQPRCKQAQTHADSSFTGWFLYFTSQVYISPCVIFSPTQLKTINNGFKTEWECSALQHSWHLPRRRGDARWQKTHNGIPGRLLLLPTGIHQYTLSHLMLSSRKISSCTEGG